MTTDAADSLVVTYLEMRSPAQLRPSRRADPKFEIRELEQPDWRFNRDLYFAVGEQWRWFDKRGWSDGQWNQYAGAPELRTFAAFYDDVLAGYYELRSQDGDAVEIAYFGLLPQFIGRGLGGALLTNAIETAWKTLPPPARVWVHTCNRDHPGALTNYLARGLKIYRIDHE